MKPDDKTNSPNYQFRPKTRLFTKLTQPKTPPKFAKINIVKSITVVPDTVRSLLKRSPKPKDNSLGSTQITTRFLPVNGNTTSVDAAETAKSSSKMKDTVSSQDAQISPVDDSIVGENVFKTENEKQTKTLDFSHNYLRPMPTSGQGWDRKKFICPYCDKIKDKKHLRTHTSIKVPECTICQVYFRYDREYESHRAEKHFKMRCQTCGKVFYDAANYELHCTRHDDPDYFHCDVCGDMVHFEYRITHRYHHTNKEFHSCGDCGKVFQSAKNLQKHSDIHKNKPEYSIIGSRQEFHSCGECGKLFQTAKNLQKHSHIHKNKPEYSMIVFKPSGPLTGEYQRLPYGSINNPTIGNRDDDSSIINADENSAVINQNMKLELNEENKKIMAQALIRIRANIQ